PRHLHPTNRIRTTTPRPRPGLRLRHRQHPPRQLPDPQGPVMGRGIGELLSDFGHTLPAKPDKPPRDPARSPFTTAPSWRGPRRRGAGWVGARPPVKQYRMTSDQTGLYWPFV